MGESPAAELAAGGAELAAGGAELDDEEDAAADANAPTPELPVPILALRCAGHRRKFVHSALLA
jgi:hypothetical protein